MDKTLFGLVSSQSRLPQLLEKLEAAHMHNISILKLNEGQSRGSMDEQRHEGDARHHKYEEKIQQEKHLEPHTWYMQRDRENLENGREDLEEMNAIEVPNLGTCQCSGLIEEDLRQATDNYSFGKSPLCASLVTRGLTDSEANRLENQVKSGKILICVHSDRIEDLDRAQDILKKEGIRSILTSPLNK